jgi:hypothetical protein
LALNNNHPQGRSSLYVKTEVRTHKTNQLIKKYAFFNEVMIPMQGSVIKFSENTFFPTITKKIQDIYDP